MPKNIVLFSDDTDNRWARRFKSNVWRLYEATDLAQPDQIAYYDDGLGTSPFRPFALLGGVVGFGLKRNVEHLYAFLCRNYQRGDRIYAFGFGRGAFSIRILVGLIHTQGLVNATTENELWRLIEDRWRAYRKQAHIRAARVLPKKFLTQASLDSSTASPQVKFNFVGLWDTRAPYDLLPELLTQAWDQYVWPLSMSDRVPSPSIEKAFHALSLNDDRPKILWTEATDPQNSTSRHIHNERISQVWFTDVHSHVAGGRSNDAHTHVSLDWIMQEASHHGLRYIPGAHAQVKAKLTINGPIYDSRKGLTGFFRYCLRKIGKFANDPYHGVLIIRPKIHASVFGRIVFGNDHNAPIEVPATYAVVDINGAICGPPLETITQAAPYSIEQRQEWDIVSTRRVVYYLTLLTSGFLALFPVLFNTGIDGACLSDYFCQISKPLAWVKPLLPSFTDRWIDAFSSNPGLFAASIIALYFMLLWSARLKRRIRDQCV